MQLSIRGMTIGLAILWGVAMLLAGIAHMIWPPYGEVFLQMTASIYPGYEASGTVGDLIVGILYAVVDGGVFGLIFAWLYNRFAPAEEKREVIEQPASVQPSP
ncbi:MAG: hypothetical protein R6U50_18535 [Desulfobacterales bacterium]